MAARAAIAGLVLAASVSAAAARGDVSGRGGFFDQASRSIDHDKKVLKRLESHPLSKASGWTIKETQGSDKGWSEQAVAGSPRLGGKEWQRKNKALEGELERMSKSVNVMFKDQGDKGRYQRDEDKLFNQAVNALKTADELYPDNPKGSSSGSGAGRHADSNFAAGGGGSIGRARQSLSKPLPRPPRSKKARSFAPNLTEIFLILSGCTMLAAAGWIGFTFFRRKSYYDLGGRRRRGGDEPDGIEVP